MEGAVREIYCCGCQAKVSARLTTGAEIYPHRSDLRELPFWKCDICKNFVGCHHKTKNRTAPLGCIPDQAVNNARKHLHALIDPLWKGGKFTRDELYQEISERIGWKYHTAKIRSVEEARKVWRIVMEIAA